MNIEKDFIKALFGVDLYNNTPFTEYIVRFIDDCNNKRQTSTTNPDLVLYIARNYTIKEIKKY